MSQQPEALWQKWKSGQNKDNATSLLDAFRPMINKEVIRHGGALPKSYLEAEAKRLAFDAFNTYNPGRAKLSTHVATKLKGLGRVNYTYQSALRMPEERQRGYTMYVQTREMLKDRLGRDPSIFELAEELRWSESEVGRMEREIHTEISEPVSNEDIIPSALFEATGPTIDYLYHDMEPEEKILFESLTGYKGGPVLSASRLAKKLKLSEPQLRRRRDKLADKIKNALS